MQTTKVDVLIVNQIEGSQTGGFTGYETEKPTYVETIAPTYLRNHFYHTFCAEPANCLQLAAAVRASGLTVKVLDGMLLNLTKEGLRRTIAEHEALIYCFSLFHSSYTKVTELIHDLKARCPNAIVTTGGNYATLVYRKLLEKNLDINYVLIGEADLSLPVLCHAIIDGKMVESVPGLAYRVPNAEHKGFTIKKNTPEIPDIDDVLPLARDYSQHILGRKFSFSMISSRGCGFGACTFCYLPPYQRISLIPKWRGMSPQKVITEMEHMRDTYGVNHITFIDEDFVGPKKNGTERLVKFAKLLIERKTNMTWYANARVLSILHLIRNGHIELLAKSGLCYLFIGIESGSDHILKRFKKGFTVAELKEVISVLHQHTIKINPGLITFLPESKPKDVKANIDIVRLIEYYDVFVFTRSLVVLPGTEEGSGCSTTTDKKIAASSSFPEQEFEKYMAIDVNVVSAQYFEHHQTRLLYEGLSHYRDNVFNLYQRRMHDQTDILEAERDFYIRSHFDFFYDLYHEVTTDRITNSENAQAYAISSLKKLTQAPKASSACVTSSDGGVIE